MGKGKIWANKWSGARLFRLDEVTFFCTFELFSQGLPLPPTQETNTETGLFQCRLQSLKAPGTSRRKRGWEQGEELRWVGQGPLGSRLGGRGREEGGKSWHWGWQSRKQWGKTGKSRGSEYWRILNQNKGTDGRVNVGWEEPGTYSQLMVFRKQHSSINFKRKFSLDFLIYLYII